MRWYLKTSGRYYKYYLYNNEMEIYKLHAFFLAEAHYIELLCYVKYFILVLQSLPIVTALQNQSRYLGMLVVYK